MNLFTELKRRNVFRVGIAYLIGAWLFTQVADVVLGVISAPDTAMRAVVAILALGFIPTVIFAWVYEMTPEGVKKASEIDADESITHNTGQKLNIATMIMVISAVAFIIFERYLPNGENSLAENAAAITQEDTGQAAAEPDETEELPATSIAVLPFANRSNQEDDLYFTDGIHDDLLTQLAKIHDLTVISRTSVMKYRDTTQTLGEIGMQLKVGTILEGGVQKVGNRVRINAQLIEVQTDRHLWAETFDRELTAENVFELQSEIARKIVNAISVELSPEEEQLLSQVPTQNLAAYDAYLRAREVFYGANYSRSQEEAALPLLERAIELDPNYVDAHVLLAMIYGQLYWRGIDTSDELLEKYRSTLDLVNQLNPNSPGALRAQANYLYRVENNYDRSLDVLKRAVHAAPGNVDIHADIAFSLRRLGRWEESIASFGRALQLDPANAFYRATMLETMESTRKWQDILDNSVALEDADPDELGIQVTRAVAIFNLTGDLEPMKQVFERMNLIGSLGYFNWSARVHMLQRDPDTAIEVLNGSVWNAGLDDQGFTRAYRNYQLAGAWRLKGDLERANERYLRVIADLETFMNSSLQTKIYGGGLVARALVFLGRSDEALALSNRLVEEVSYEEDALVAASPIYSRALIRGLAGDADGAIEDLSVFLETPTAGSVTPWELHLDPTWDFMRDDPRFVELATPENLIQ